MPLGGRILPSFCLIARQVMSMDAFFSSTVLVALAEIGDKTQLLALFLAARFRQKYAISAGIFAATLLNHALSAWIGVWLAARFSPTALSWLVGGSFLAVGLWLLRPDKDDSQDSPMMKYGAFFATFILFFLAEIGDKTQLATVFLAARYHEMWAVLVGSTLGLMLANVPVVYLGARLLNRMPTRIVRLSACALFCAMGLWTVWQNY